jgi:putative hydrolase of the HAD superfamily
MMKSLPRALLLDLDDTILSFSAIGDRCWENLCISFALRLGHISPDELLTAINQSRNWFWSDPDRHRQGRLDLTSARRRIVRIAFEQLQLNDYVIGDELADSFTTMREELVQPFPGALETLQAFQRQGVHMGLITNGDASFQRSKIHRFNLERYFDVILIENEFGVGKPDKRVFLYALERLSVTSMQAWMIGNDLEYDIRPAQELGMAAVWIDCAKTGLPPDSSVVPSWTTSSLAELAAHLGT